MKIKMVLLALLYRMLSPLKKVLTKFSQFAGIGMKMIKRIKSVNISFTMDTFRALASTASGLFILSVLLLSLVLVLFDNW